MSDCAGMIRVIAAAVLGFTVAAAAGILPALAKGAAEQALQRGIEAGKAKDYATAIRELLSAKLLTSHDSNTYAQVLFNLGVAYVKSGNPLQGLLWLRASQAAAPTTAQNVAWSLEISRLKAQLLAERDSIFNQAISIANGIDRAAPPPYGSADYDTIIKFMADTRVRVGDFYGAQTTFAKVTRRSKFADQDFEDRILVNQARVAALTGHFDGADELFGKLKDPAFAVSGMYVAVPAGSNDPGREKNTKIDPRAIFWMRIANQLIDYSDHQCWRVDVSLSKQARERAGRGGWNPWYDDFDAGVLGEMAGGGLGHLFSRNSEQSAQKQCSALSPAELWGQFAKHICDNGSCDLAAQVRQASSGPHASNVNDISDNLTGVAGKLGYQLQDYEILDARTAAH